MSEHASLTAALAAFQADLPEVSKGSTNPAFKSKYADLADVVKVVLPALARHGLAWVTAPDVTEHGMVLRYELRHTSGDTITGSWPLPDNVKAQELGSWITYGRRYTLGAVTGIAPDEDDDGNGAKGSAGAPRRESNADKITAAITAISAAQDAAKLDEIEQYAQQLGINGVEKVKKAIEAKRAELGSSGVDHWVPVAEVPK